MPRTQKNEFVLHTKKKNIGGNPDSNTSLKSLARRLAPHVATALATLLVNDKFFKKPKPHKTFIFLVESCGLHESVLDHFIKQCRPQETVVIRSKEKSPGESKSIRAGSSNKARKNTRQSSRVRTDVAGLDGEGAEEIDVATLLLTPLLSPLSRKNGKVVREVREINNALIMDYRNTPQERPILNDVKTFQKKNSFVYLLKAGTQLPHPSFENVANKDKFICFVPTVDKKNINDQTRKYLAQYPDTIIIDIPIIDDNKDAYREMAYRLMNIIKVLSEDNVDIGKLFSQMHDLHRREFIDFSNRCQDDLTYKKSISSRLSKPEF